MTDIIIPHWGGTSEITALAVRCLQTIRDHSTDYRVIWVDNGTPVDQFDPLLPILKTVPHLLVRNRLNQGFIKATNQGLCSATAPYVVLMNNDTEAVPGWIEKLRMPFQEDLTVGISGPLTTTRNSWQGRAREGDSWAMLPYDSMLAFFCSMFRREVFDKCGLLDEDFGVGLGDDDMFCLRAERAGYRLALVHSLRIPHHHRTSFSVIYGDEVPAMQRDALKLFHEKRNA